MALGAFALVFVLILSPTLGTGPFNGQLLGSQSEPVAAPALSTTSTTAPPEVAEAKMTAAEVAEEVSLQIFDLVNKERTSRGIPALKWNDELTEAALRWSQEMDASGHFEHQDLGVLLRETDGRFGMVGENIIKATADDTAAEMHQAWMDSPGHRRNILDPDFDRLGVAFVTTGEFTYGTQQFGTAASKG